MPRRKYGASTFFYLPDQTGKKHIRLPLQQPLLHYALMPLEASDAPFIDTVQFLLSQGSSPNEAFRGTTVWAEFLICLGKRHNEVTWDEYFVITRALLRNGASLSYVVPNQKPARQYIEDYFTSDQVMKLEAASRSRRGFRLF